MTVPAASNATEPSRKSKRRRTQAERSEEMRGRLIRAAFEVMKRRGYSGFRVAEVHKLAGVSRGAQLHHFPTKDSLVLAALDHVFFLSRQRTEQRIRRKSQTEDPFAAVMADSHDFFFGDHFWVALDILMSAGKNRKVRDRVIEIARQQRPPAERIWLDMLLSAGVPRDQAEDLLWITVSIVRGHAIRALWQNEPQRFERHFKLWREMAWFYVNGKVNGAAVGDAIGARGASIRRDA